MIATTYSWPTVLGLIESPMAAGCGYWTRPWNGGRLSG